MKNQDHKIGELIFFIFFSVISAAGCILLLIGTFGRSADSSKYSALCFAAAFGSLAIYLLQKKNKAHILFFVLSLLCIFVFLKF